jgi:hypothetical protein
VSSHEASQFHSIPEPLNQISTTRTPGARELRLDLRDVRPEDLTEAVRRELRLLFQELSMLARARPGAPRVFPPLPVAGKR